MLPALARRGPDSEGLYTWPGITFGHRRLAILDLSAAGAQPMLSEDRTVGVVFNGCIYNFLEIRKTLEQSGHTFRSQCDTEILIEGYREWGIDGLVSRLRGMFAFAIWDQTNRKLTLARDRLGVKPLVYWSGDAGIAFASTLAALQAGGFAGDIDPQAVLEFLEFGFVTDECAIFAGMRKLPPATILEWQDGRIRQWSYWKLEGIEESSNITFEEAVEETERLILEAVRIRLISDVPVGVLLSGGIDSALICWALAKLNTRVRAFTVGTPGDPEDETAAARSIARALDIPHEIVPLSSDQAAPLEELLGAYSEPFASQSALGMLKVSRAVKPFATVLLTGDGGDDVYLGYPFFYNAWRAQELARRLPSFTPAIWRGVRPICSAMPALKRAKSFLDYTVGGIGAYARVRRGLPYLRQMDLLGPRLSGLTLPHRDVPDSFDSGRNLLSDVFSFHRRMHFTSEFMTKVDGGAMYHSLEARAPFLDQHMWEFAAKLPPKLRFQGGHLKAILREIVRRHIGPEVAYRKKQGFSIPVERWLLTQWSAPLNKLKSGTLLEKDGWVNARSLANAIGQAQGQGEAPFQLWCLLVLEGWLQKLHRTSSSPVVSLERD